MRTLNPCKSLTELVLHAQTAAQLMTPNPVSINQDSTAAEAAAFLTSRGISAAPVIDAAGRPIGVVSRSDMLLPNASVAAARRPVHTIMTPAVFCVRPSTPAAGVVEMMVDLGVRRLFVVDDSGVLIGVISALDVLRRLHKRKRRLG